jgi:diguanylate cyclase (GGDEF)-like protein
VSERIAGGRLGWNHSSGSHEAFRGPTFAMNSTVAATNGLAQLTRQERWLSFVEFVVLLLTAAGFVTASLPHSLRDHDPMFDIRSAEAVVGLLGLLLLFQAHAAQRHWQILRERRRLLAETGLAEDAAVTVGTSGASSREANSLLNRKQIEEQLGKEIARARRTGRPLSLLILSVDEMQLIGQRYGAAMVERVLQEFTQRLKRATRGCDFAERLGGDVFLAVLWDCPVGSVQRVLERVSPLVLNCDGKEIPVACSSAWVDDQAGDTPTELMTRAEQMLQLYKKVDQASSGPILTVR